MIDVLAADDEAPALAELAHLLRADPRVGEIVTARVTFVRRDGRLNASLREAKEKTLETDAARILELLAVRKGKMPYSDKTSPEVLRDKFGISKAAFKRALGHLLKEGRVYKADGWTYLKEMPQPPARG